MFREKVLTSAFQLLRTSSLESLLTLSEHVKCLVACIARGRGHITANYPGFGERNTVDEKKGTVALGPVASK
jgi:hypothetical protein